MIKILHIVSDLDINSGAMNVVMNYYRHMDRDRIQFDFAYFYEKRGTYEKEIRELGGNVVHIGKPSFSRAYQRKLRGYFERQWGGYKAVHCHPIWASEIVAREAKKAGIKHIIQHSHSTRLGNNTMSSLRNRFMMAGISFFATDYAACSEEAARLLGRKKKVQIIRNAIDCSRFCFSEVGRTKVRKQLNISENEIVIGHVGRFSEEKNQGFLVNVFEKLLDKEKDVKLLLVGDGPLKSQLENIVNSNKAISAKVIFAGKRTDIPDILSAMDVFVLPSKYEGVPFAVIEAQACSLHCIISDTVTRAVASGLTTYVSLDDSIQHWVDSIIQVCEQAVNRESESTIANLGYDICVEARKIQSYYEALS